jgi:hypothetical protein
MPRRGVPVESGVCSTKGLGAKEDGMDLGRRITVVADFTQVASHPLLHTKSTLTSCRPPFNEVKVLTEPSFRGTVP